VVEELYYLLLSLAAAFCAHRGMISKPLLPSTLYLACVSVLVSVMLYMLGAFEVAGIECRRGVGHCSIGPGSQRNW